MATNRYTDRTVVLSSSRLSHAFEPDESFWADEISRIKLLIREHMDDINGAPFAALMGEDGHFRNLLSIALFGTYGSGKSSLLRTLVKEINGEAAGTGPSDGISLHPAYSLHVIEPALLEGGNFLYAFLAEALERERAKRNNNDLMRQSALLQKVQDLSEYLQAVDGDSKWGEDDPIGASLAQLERQTSGLLLRAKMNEFLDALAEELTGHKKGVVILPVDDADMNPETLVETLQLYRRFLQHPRLVPIFTFTGRVAEELLRSHFEEKLKIGEKPHRSDALKEVSTKITIAENLAQQYLGKLFPVRNRIKLGMAAARAQQATIAKVSREKQATLAEKRTRVIDLLRDASVVLFGRPRMPLTPAIRAPLRSSTMRRQIQIIDAIDAAEVKALVAADKHFCDPDQHQKPDMAGLRSFAQVYDGATWSLLNVHRDVLKELSLHLEDLYSWTAHGLRQAILVGLLRLELGYRRDILNHWRFGTEDRRSLMLSLLAANAFRPRMYPEEPTGDNPNQIRLLVERAGLPAEDEPEDQSLKRRLSFSCRKGVIWFLNLWHGFYLPQLIARDRPTSVDRNPKYEPVTGIGWNMRNAAVNAVLEAIQNNQSSSTGMLFLNPIDFAQHAAYASGQKKNPVPVKGAKHDLKELSWYSLMCDIWCLYGTDRGRPWAAVSFWRGLSLMGQILQATVDHSPDGRIEDKDRVEVKTMFGAIIHKHLRAAHVLGRPDLKGRVLENTEFYAQWGKWTHPKLREMVESLSEQLLVWVNDFDPLVWRIFPLSDVASDVEPVAGAKKPDVLNERWKACFLRRMHGEHLVGYFWQELQNPYSGELTNAFPRENKRQAEHEFDLKSEPDCLVWSARHALSKWFETLMKYWGCGSPVVSHEPVTDRRPENRSLKENRTQVLIAACPFVRPFVPYPLFQVKQLIRQLERTPESEGDIGKHLLVEMKQIADVMKDHWDAHSFFSVCKSQLEEFYKCLRRWEEMKLTKGAKLKATAFAEKYAWLHALKTNFEAYRQAGHLLQIYGLTGARIHP